MGIGELSRLSEGGLAAFPPTALTDAATWARQFCWASGDVRYCIISETLFRIDRWWDFDTPYLETVRRLDVVLKDLLRASLIESDPETARYLALALHNETCVILAVETQAGSGSTD